MSLVAAYSSSDESDSNDGEESTTSLESENSQKEKRPLQNEIVDHNTVTASASHTHCVTHSDTVSDSDNVTMCVDSVTVNNVVSDTDDSSHGHHDIGNAPQTEMISSYTNADSQSVIVNNVVQHSHSGTGRGGAGDSVTTCSNTDVDNRPSNNILITHNKYNCDTKSNTILSSKTYLNEAAVEEFHISDEEDDILNMKSTASQSQEGPVSLSSRPNLSLPRPNKLDSQPVEISPMLTSQTIENDNKSNKKCKTLFSSLPLPKLLENTEILPSKPKHAVVGDDELEDIVKPREAELADVKKPPQMTKRRKIKITAPSMPDPDSDDEDDMPTKKTKLSECKSGSKLFGLLPAPAHATKKEMNRVLLPHTLKKKSSETDNKSTTKKIKSPSLNKTSTSTVIKLAGVPDDSDDEEDDTDESSGVNFFSLAAGNKNSTRSTISAFGSTTLNLHRPISTALEIDKDATMPITSKTEMVENKNLDNEAVSPTSKSDSDAESNNLADAPLQFKTVEPSFDHHMAPSSSYYSKHASAAVMTNQQYNYANLEQEAPEMYPSLPKNENQAGVDDEGLQYLQGKKKRREAINIIDVHGDDQVREVDLTKAMTEETGPTMSHSKKKNKDLPSSQQKRKHQITYLAFRAKEQETDLKNQWAENRMTKKQTQSKYGF